MSSKKKIYEIDYKIYQQAPKAERNKKVNEINLNQNGYERKIYDNNGKYFDKNETISSLRRRYQNQRKRKNEE